MKLSQHIHAPKCILFLYLLDYNFKQNKNLHRVKISHYWKDPAFRKQGPIWKSLLQCPLIHTKSPYWSLCTKPGRRGTGYKITMPILKELTVPHITRGYLSSWAVPENVGIQVRDRERDRKKKEWSH